MKILGIDIGGTFIKFGVLSTDKIIHQYEVVNNATNVDEFINLLDSNIIELSSKFELLCIGIGFPGNVNNQGIVISSPNLKFLKTSNFTSLVAKITNLPFIIENDAFLAAYAESKVNKIEEYYFVTLGTGIGSALVKNNELVKSNNGSSGELGHIIIDFKKNGNDYRAGIFENYFNANQFVIKAKEELKNFPNSFIKSLDDFSVREISDGVAMGDDLCIINFIEMGKILGIGFSSVANLTGIAIFVIGGGISNANSLLFDSALNEMKKRTIPELIPFIKIKKSELTNMAGIYGAAYFAKEKLL